MIKMNKVEARQESITQRRFQTDVYSRNISAFDRSYAEPTLK